jgi:hypothetical protein
MEIPSPEQQMQDRKWAFQVPMGLVAAHVIVAALSVRIGPCRFRPT